MISISIIIIITLLIGFISGYFLATYNAKNIQFNEIIPQFNTITPQNTNISANIRTVSGTSSGGEESPFADQGFEPVLLNQVNEFSTPRIVASRVNEVNYLTTLPSSKSLTLGIRMETSDTNVSPVIDLSEAATFVFNRNRLNKPISDVCPPPPPPENIVPRKFFFPSLRLVDAPVNRRRV